MKKITAEKVEVYNTLKHKLVLCINRATKKSFVFSHEGRVISLPSSDVDSRKAAMSDMRLGAARCSSFLSASETRGYELYTVNQDEFARIAAHALLATSELKHFDELVTMFVDEKTKTASTSLIPT